jgi:hypothetical protein
MKSVMKNATNRVAVCFSFEVPFDGNNNSFEEDVPHDVPIAGKTRSEGANELLANGCPAAHE